MGVKAGLDPKVLLDIINASSGRNSATQDKFPRAILPRTFDFGATLNILMKDVDLAIAAAGDDRLPLLEALSRQWRAAVEAGHGRDDVSAARLALGNQLSHEERFDD